MKKKKVKLVDLSILLVDQDQKSRNNLSSRLRSQGFEIENATSGFHAVHLVEKTEYHLVLVIDDMDDMSGSEMVGLMRSIKERENLKIIYLYQETTDQNDMGIIMSTEANEILKKGVDFNTLLVKITAVQKFWTDLRDAKKAQERATKKAK